MNLSYSIKSTTLLSNDLMNIMHQCQVCYKLITDDQILAVDGIEYDLGKRVTPWYVCKSCAQKISDTYREKESEEHE